MSSQGNSNSFRQIVNIQIFRDCLLLLSQINDKKIY